MKLITTLSVMSCALFLHTNLQAGEILIDDFSTDQAEVSDTTVVGGGKSSQVSSAGSDIIGGYRDIYVEEVESGIARAPEDPSLGIHAQVSSGRFSATLDDLVKGFVVVTYDGANTVGRDWQTGVDTNGLMSQDWTGTTGFVFEEVSNDIVAPVQLIIWTEDNMDGMFVKHIADFSTLGDINETGLYNSFISAAWFNDAGSINWSSVGAFQAVFNLDSTGDIENSEISVDLSLSRAVAVQVPEPAVLSMFGAGLLMFGFAGSRRKKSEHR